MPLASLNDILNAPPSTRIPVPHRNRVKPRGRNFTLHNDITYNVNKDGRNILITYMHCNSNVAHVLCNVCKQSITRINFDCELFYDDSRLYHKPYTCADCKRKPKVKSQKSSTVEPSWDYVNLDETISPAMRDYAEMETRFAAQIQTMQERNAYNSSWVRDIFINNNQEENF